MPDPAITKVQVMALTRIVDEKLEVVVPNRAAHVISQFAPVDRSIAVSLLFTRTMPAPQ